MQLVTWTNSHEQLVKILHGKVRQPFNRVEQHTGYVICLLQATAVLFNVRSENLFVVVNKMRTHLLDYVSGKGI